MTLNELIQTFKDYYKLREARQGKSAADVVQQLNDWKQSRNGIQPVTDAAAEEYLRAEETLVKALDDYIDRRIQAVLQERSGH